MCTFLLELNLVISFVNVYIFVVDVSDVTMDIWIYFKSLNEVAMEKEKVRIPFFQPTVIFWYN